MSTTLEQPLLTPDDFLSHPDRDRCELVDCRLVETFSTMESVWVAGQLIFELNTFATSRRLGWVYSSGLTYRCFTTLEEDRDRILITAAR